MRGGLPPLRGACGGAELAEVSPGMLRSPSPRTPMSLGDAAGDLVQPVGTGVQLGGLGGGVARPPAHPDAPGKDGTTPGKKLFTK